MGKSLNSMERFIMDLREYYGHDTDGYIRSLEQALKVAFIMSRGKEAHLLKEETEK